MKGSLAVFLFIVHLPLSAAAGEISHYSPGVPNIRDFLIPPESGFYVSSYNFYFQSGRLNDAAGDETTAPIYDVENDEFTDLYPDVDVYAMSLPIIAVKKELFEISETKIDYAAMVVPLVANSSVGASLTAETEGGSDPVTSQFGFGDLYVQPLSIGYSEPVDWAKKSGGRYAWSLAWGFYAPTGKYDTLPANHPIAGPIRIPSLENIGSGFWTNQFRGAVQWSPFGVDGPALVLAGTYEINSEKKDLHVTPGDHFTFNWGLSQFLPLSETSSWLFEFGPAGYSSWQVTSDRGRGRLNAYQDEVHAAGFQIGLTEAICKNSINFHYFNEYDAEDRFQGHVIGLSFSLHFGAPAPFDVPPLEKPNCACSWREVKAVADPPAPEAQGS